MQSMEEQLKPFQTNRTQKQRYKLNSIVKKCDEVKSYKSIEVHWPKQIEFKRVEAIFLDFTILELQCCSCIKLIMIKWNQFSIQI